MKNRYFRKGTSGLLAAAMISFSVIGNTGYSMSQTETEHAAQRITETVGTDESSEEIKEEILETEAASETVPEECLVGMDVFTASDVEDLEEDLVEMDMSAASDEEGSEETDVTVVPETEGIEETEGTEETEAAAVPEIEDSAETDAAVMPDAEGSAESDISQETDTDTEIETDTAVVPEVDSEAITEGDRLPETDTVTEIETDADTNHEKSSETVSETDVEQEEVSETEENSERETNDFPESDSETEQKSEQELGSEQDSESETGSGTEPESAAEWETGMEEDSETDSESEFTEIELPELTEEEIALFAAYTPPGTLASASGTGYTVVKSGDRRYSGNYCEVQKTAASTVTPWDNSGGRVIHGSRKNSGGKQYTYLMPKDDTAAGKFGFRVTNVAYNRAEKCAVDLIITVTAYQDYTYSAAGNRIEGIYPCIGYTPGGGLAYQASLPAIRLKCDLVRSGTDILVAGNYRFTLTDIDTGQIYGLALYNGSLDARYCLESTVIHSGTRTLSDGNTYHMIYAPDISSSESNKNHAVSFEVSNMSSFGFYISSAKRSGNTGGYSADTIRGAYEDIKDGTWDYGTEEASGALMGWDSWAFGPPEIGPLNKYVSNDQTAWSSENMLPAISSEYWYLLEVYVPEMSGYSYRQFVIQDTLPAGVDYAGEYSVIKAETGENVSSYFSSATGGDDLIYTYNGTSGFGGYTYQLYIKARLDTSEKDPVISGTAAQYSVQNQAVLYYQTNADASALSLQSNPVVTRAQISRPVPELPKKKINWNGTMQDTREYAGRSEPIVFSVSQKIPAYISGWRMTSFLFEDELDPCFELVRITLGTEQNPGETVFEAAQSGTTKNNWNFQRTGQKITAALNAAGMPAAHFSGSTVYRMDITVKVKEEYDLFGYYQQISPGKQMAVIPNRASAQFVWGSEVLRQDTNEVKVLISEVFGTLELTKINSNTDENVPNAEFRLQQWNGSGWEYTQTFTYAADTKKYRLKQYLLKTEKNQGRFKIVESEVPYGFKGSWEKEIVLDGTNGVCRTMSYQAANHMAVGYITVKKTSQTGTVLSGAVYEIIARSSIVSPQGKIMYQAGTKVAEVTTGADGTARSGELFPGEYEVRELIPPAGYTRNTAPQTVQIKYRNKDEGASHETVTFQNRQTLVYLRKYSAEVPGEAQKKPLSDISFAVWNKNTETEQKAARYTTDGKGEIVLRGLVPGTYCYKETMTPAGYVPDTSVREFTIDQNGYCGSQETGVLTVDNQYICAEFAKKDRATGQHVAGAKLQLTDSNGNVVDTWISQENSYRIYRIKAGTYTLTELEAPAGYKKAEPVTVEIQAVNKIQTYTMYDIKYVTLTLEKSILAEEIVWAHGNPTFTFCVEGEDLDGEKHTYYETVEFTEAGKTEGSVLQKTVLTVPAGMYTVSEQNVIRYRLEKIDGVAHGQVSGPAVLFDLRANQNGKAVFHNRKTTDHGLSETDFVRNVISFLG